MLLLIGAVFYRFVPPSNVSLEMTGTGHSALRSCQCGVGRNIRSGRTHIKHIEQNRLGIVLRHLRQPGAPVTVSPPSGTEARSGPGGTGGVGRGRRLQCRRPRPGAGDVRINPGLAVPIQWQ